MVAEVRADVADAQTTARRHQVLDMLVHRFVENVDLVKDNGREEIV